MMPEGPMAACASSVCSRTSATSDEVLTTSSTVTATRASNGTASATASFVRMGSRRNVVSPVSTEGRGATAPIA